MKGGKKSQFKISSLNFRKSALDFQNKAEPPRFSNLASSTNVNSSFTRTVTDFKSKRRAKETKVYENIDYDIL